MMTQGNYEKETQEKIKEHLDCSAGDIVSYINDLASELSELSESMGQYHGAKGPNLAQWNDDRRTYAALSTAYCTASRELSRVISRSDNYGGNPNVRV